MQTYIESFEKIDKEVYVYYSNESISKTNKMNDKEFLNNLNNYNLICSYE